MRHLVVAVVVLLAVQACAQQPDTTSTPSPSGKEILGQECFSPPDQYRIGYPDGWHSNDPEGGGPCSWFHPERFELPTATEPTEIAIHIDVTESAFDEMTDAVTSGEHVKDLLSREDDPLADAQALRVEIVNSGQGLYPEGTRQTTWAVQWEPGTLTATTTDAAEGEYADSVDVLDRMMKTLERDEPEVACSASALDPILPESENLPDAVAATRTDIAEAAVTCDYDRLGELAQRGEETFIYSFGGDRDPAGYWRQQEADQLGSEPMRYLVGMLKRSFETREVDGQTQYLWPAAFAYDSWDSVPDEDKEALKPLYDELSFQGFAEFGGYGGYRVGIDAAGNWLFFVAGD